MKQTFRYGEYVYDYYIEFSERKSYTLIVRPDLRIITRVPLDASLDDIEGFLKRKWQWLEKQLSELRTFKKTRTEKQYISGESFYYLGRQYMLLVEKSTEDTVKLEHGKLRILSTKAVRNSSHNKKLLDEWYAKKRERVFKSEFLKALTLFNYETIPQLGQRIMVRRWGSYTADDKVLLNPRLIEAPREAIFYICVHELCHRISRKHDEIFYNELEKRISNWRVIKNQLEIRFG